MGSNVGGEKEEDLDNWGKKWAGARGSNDPPGDSQQESKEKGNWNSGKDNWDWSKGSNEKEPQKKNKEKVREERKRGPRGGEVWTKEEWKAWAEEPRKSKKQQNQRYLMRR